MLTLILSSIGFAVPLQVTQQGRILDSNGAGVSGLHDLTFRIYDAETSGTLLWEETITETMTNGYYAAVLGADETNNPLDSTILELYPIYLEFQLDSNSPVATRQAINSAPYAQIAGKAEVATSVNGGSVNATDVQISGNPVIDGTGSWVGPAITVDWNNIDPSTIPSYIADGDDNTQLSKTEVLNYVDGETLNLGASSQVDGSDIVTADSFSTYLPADADTLASLNCATGEIASWDGNSSWVCTSDNTLEWADIELLLNNNPVDLNASTTIGGAEIITTVDDADTLATLSCSDSEIAKYDSGLGDWYCDVDVDTTLTSTEVTTIVEAGSVNLATGSQVNGKNLIGEPSGCTDGQILVFNFSTQEWSCGDDTDTTLTATEMQSMIESMTLNMSNHPSVNGSPVLTEDSTLDPTNLDSSSASTDQVLKFDGSAVTWGESSGGCELTEVFYNTSGSIPTQVLLTCGSEQVTIDYAIKPTDIYVKNQLSCTLDYLGKIYCWGSDNNNQVSDIPTDAGHTSLGLGEGHVCAIDSSGSIQCWGQNHLGQASPPSGTFTDVDAGGLFGCAINSSGSIQCWGQNHYGQASPPSGTFTKIALGNYHGCAIDSSGSIQCWGSSGNGRLNAPSGTFEQIKADNASTCAISSTGTASCWGDFNGYNPPTFGTLIDVSFGSRHGCAIEDDYSLECWGYNYSLQATVPSHVKFKRVDVGGDHTCGIDTKNQIHCWGYDGLGQVSGIP